MVNQQYYNNLKGLSCSFLLLFGTFSLLVLSVTVVLFAPHLPNLWPYLLVLSVYITGLLSCMQMKALRAGQSQEGVSTNISTIPTITEILSARESSFTYAPPPPYSEANSYQIFKPAVSEGSDGSTAPPPSYEVAIKAEVTVTHKSIDENNSRTCRPNKQLEMV